MYCNKFGFIYFIFISIYLKYISVNAAILLDYNIDDYNNQDDQDLNNLLTTGSLSILFRELDKNENNQLDLKEFIEIMKYWEKFCSHSGSKIINVKKETNKDYSEYMHLPFKTIDLTMDNKIPPLVSSESRSLFKSSTTTIKENHEIINKHIEHHNHHNHHRGKHKSNKSNLNSSSDVDSNVNSDQSNAINSLINLTHNGKFIVDTHKNDVLISNSNQLCFKISIFFVPVLIYMLYSLIT